MVSPQEVLRGLIDGAAVMSLATLDHGLPSVSLVPFVVGWGPFCIAALVSELSPHTSALRASPTCAWMIHDPPTPGDPRSNHALTRVMGNATARFLSRDEAREATFEARYREKYPIAETLLGLRDFHFVRFEITAASVSFVQGFGKAWRVRGADLDAFEHVTGR
jgi:hypothetical protein